jgi:hypothetical protein
MPPRIRKFVWLDNSEHEMQDPKWTKKKAEAAGLIKPSSPSKTVQSATPPPSAALLQHIEDCRRAAESTPD